MFYSISKQIDARFPHCKNMNAWWICTDSGWQHIQNDNGHFWIKGYSDTVRLEELINNWALTPPGNYTIIRSTDTIEIKTPCPRSYPLAFTGNSITNLIDDQPVQRIFANQQVKVDSKWQIQVDNVEVPLPLLDSNSVAENAIVDILTTTAKAFLQKYQPQLKLFLSGGLDTALIQALLNHLGYPYQILTDEYYEQDWFTNHNRSVLEDDTYSESGWGYRQIHHYTTPTWITTGAWGDEYFLRGPELVSMISSWHGIDILKQLTPQHYHYEYYNRHADKFNHIYADRNNLTVKFKNLSELNNYILQDWLPNDFQHWHLGNTLTWTPLKQLDISQLILNLPLDKQIAQFCDGQLTKNVIKLLDSSVLDSVSRYKNS